MDIRKLVKGLKREMQQFKETTFLVLEKKVKTFFNVIKL
jgi:hypothetical protein